MKSIHVALALVATISISGCAKKTLQNGRQSSSNPAPSNPSNHTPVDPTENAPIAGSLGQEAATTSNSNVVVPVGDSGDSDAAARQCTSTLNSFTDECAVGYPDSACNCGFGSQCQTAWDNVYWDKQPEALRKLRWAGQQDGNATALDLANQGYCIDVPIMVWGWSASSVTCARQQYGYTWLPSALQQNIPVAPGLSFPGLPSYDPDHIPVGAIPVPKAVDSCSVFVANWDKPNGDATCNGRPTPTCKDGYGWVGSCSTYMATGWDGVCIKGQPAPKALPDPNAPPPPRCTGDNCCIGAFPPSCASPKKFTGACTPFGWSGSCQ